MPYNQLMLRQKLNVDHVAKQTLLGRDKLPGGRSKESGPSTCNSVPVSRWMAKDVAHYGRQLDHRAAVTKARPPKPEMPWHQDVDLLLPVHVSAAIWKPNI